MSFESRVWTYGRQIQLDLLDEQPRDIIGVVGDVRQNRYDTTAPAQVYVPQDQLPRRMDLNIARQVLVQTFIVRTNGAPPIAALRAAVREIDPSAAFSSVRTVDEYPVAQLQDLRQYTALLTLFGTVSALLCVIGIFGIMAHAVMRRRNEIGIRMALGAPKASVLRLILRQGLLLVATGMALGMVAAIALTQVIRSFLWGDHADRSGDVHECERSPRRTGAHRLLRTRAPRAEDRSDHRAPPGVIAI